MIKNNYCRAKALPYIALISLCVFIFSSNLHAGFNILPTKILIDKDNRVENLKLTNTSDKEVTVKVKAFKWSQDKDGKELYLESKGLTYFPRILTIKPKEDKFVKIGFDGKPSGTEETFRIIAEEVPQADKEEGTRLKIALKMDIPVFIAPSSKKIKKGEISGALLSQGKLSFGVKNKGNAHFFIKKIKLQGGDPAGGIIYTDEKQGWYVLSGKEKFYSFDIPKDKCQSLKEINIDLDLDGEVIKDKVNVDKKKCSQ